MYWCLTSFDYAHKILLCITVSLIPVAWLMLLHKRGGNTGIALLSRRFSIAISSSLLNLSGERRNPRTITDIVHAYDYFNYFMLSNFVCVTGLLFFFFRNSLSQAWCFPVGLSPRDPNNWLCSWRAGNVHRLNANSLPLNYMPLGTITYIHSMVYLSINNWSARY